MDMLGARFPRYVYVLFHSSQLVVCGELESTIVGVYMYVFLVKQLGMLR